VDYVSPNLRLFRAVLDDQRRCISGYVAVRFLKILAVFQRDSRLFSPLTNDWKEFSSAVIRDRARPIGSDSLSPQFTLPL